MKCGRIQLGIATLVLPVAMAQTHPDLAELLKNVSETYKSAVQYELVGDATSADARSGKIGSFHMRIAFKAPNKYRIEGQLPRMNFGGVEFGDGIIVHDGSAAWFYFPKVNQYGSFSADRLTAEAEGDLGDLRPEFVDQVVMSGYRGAVERAPGAKFLREETISLGGSRVACYVVAITPAGDEPSNTWWVDRKRHVVVREDQGGSSVVFTSVRLGEPLAPELFRFVPPPGAKKLEMHE